MIYLDNLIIDVGVEDTRHKAGANALDLMRTRRAPRQHWALARLHCHHMHWLLGLQELPCPRDCAACAYAADKDINLQHDHSVCVRADSNYLQSSKRTDVFWACVPIFMAAHQSCREESNTQGNLPGQPNRSKFLARLSSDECQHWLDFQTAAGCRSSSSWQQSLLPLPQHPSWPALGAPLSMRRIPHRKVCLTGLRSCDPDIHLGRVCQEELCAEGLK